MNGPAFMAIRAKVPIVPMALVGTHELLPIHAKHFFPVPVLLAIGEPIETSGYSPRDVEALTSVLRTAITRLYYQHSYVEEPATASLADISTPMESL